MTKYLFLFTIGPVQSFISQARKTHDLYAGSKLLSDLVDFAIKEIGQDKIIFPNKTVQSKPNRFLAKIEAKNSDEVKSLGKNIEKSVKENFRSISDKIFKENFKGINKPENFDNQIEKFLDIYWVAKEIDNSGYKSNYEEIESLLGSVKNIREFEQLEEQGRKCSLCGERNVLIYKRNKNKIPAFIQNDAIEYKKNQNYILNSGEGLCAVCFTKRDYNKESINNFPSTAKIALLHSIKNIDTSIFNAYFEQINRKKIPEYQLFYEENLRKDYFMRNGLDDMVDKIQAMESSLKDIKKSLKNDGLKLSKYYAMIMFDGDSMGKWLSGKYLSENINLKEFHNDFSKLLGEYGNWAKDYLDGAGNGTIPKGKAVYAGGDDFMGFINLQYLFEVLKELREQFDKKVNDKLKEYKKEGENLTFSAGIVIAHYKTPLGEVINWARQMEKEAKDIDDKKDAFSLAVLKHSGDINKTRYKWYDGIFFIPDYMRDIVKALKNGEFSNNFIKTLQVEFEKLIDKDGKLEVEKPIDKDGKLEVEKPIDKDGKLEVEKPIGKPDMLETEINRLVKKSCMLSVCKEEKQKAIKELSEKVLSLSVDRDNFRSFLHFLNISDFIAREMPAKFEESK